MGGGERVDGEQAEGRLTVDGDHVVVVRGPAGGMRQHLLPGDLTDELDLGRRQVDVGWG